MTGSVFLGKIRLTFVLHQTELSRFIKEPYELSLDEGGTVIDAIKLVDEEIIKRAGTFPVKGYKSLLHMVYHPFENRFYKQVGIQGYTGPGSFFNVRENPQSPLPNSITIIIVPQGHCISEGEDVVDW